MLCTLLSLGFACALWLFALHTGAMAVVWLPLIPMVLYLLLERRLAGCLSLGWLATVIVAIRSTHATDPGITPEPLGLLQVLVAALAATAVCDLAARRRDRALRREQDLRRQVVTDSLTGLRNRAGFLAGFEAARAHSQATGQPLTIALIDLDRFKDINDRLGHHGGDAALGFFARGLLNTLPEAACAGRIGGEEFAVVLPGMRATAAQRLLDGYAAQLAADRFLYEGHPVKLSFSLGVAELATDGNDWPVLYRSADHRLYRSKRARQRLRVGEGLHSAA